MEQLSPAQRMSEGTIAQGHAAPAGRRDWPARRPFGERRRAGLTAQDRRPPLGHATRSPRRAPLPNAPGGTSRRPSGRKRCRRAPVSPRRPSPRMPPLRGPRCRKLRRSTSWHFLQSSCLLDAAAMLRRTGVLGGDASRRFSGKMPGFWCRCRHPANRDVRHPGALRSSSVLGGGRIGRRGRSIARMPHG